MSLAPAPGSPILCYYSRMIIYPSCLKHQQNHLFSCSRREGKKEAFPVPQKRLGATVPLQIRLVTLMHPPRAPGVVSHGVGDRTTDTASGGILPSIPGPLSSILSTPGKLSHFKSFATTSTSDQALPSPPSPPSDTAANTLPLTSLLFPPDTETSQAVAPSSVVAASSGATISVQPIQTVQNSADSTNILPATSSQSTSISPAQTLASSTSPTASSQPTTSSRTPSPIPAILGAVAGLLVVSVLAALFVLLRRRKLSNARRLLDADDVIVQDLSSNKSGARVLALNPPNASARWVVESQEEALRKLSEARRRSGDGTPSGNATPNEPEPTPSHLLVQHVHAMAERMALMEARLSMSRDGAEGPPEYASR
ncbi:hypothetical protein C8F01DRAFT_1121741 [Mycena amicta]|nr:hypothetical protein C8F01DRAFT_1121741 [Mycena amicta]